MIDLESLGLVAADHEIVLRNILRPHGMILSTGPTGSGKTSSLYAMLSPDRERAAEHREYLHDRRAGRVRRFPA